MQTRRGSTTLVQRLSHSKTAIMFVKMSRPDVCVSHPVAVSDPLAERVQSGGAGVSHPVAEVCRFHWQNRVISSGRKANRPIPARVFRQEILLRFLLDNNN